jgi:hypothetical protein
VAINSTEIGQAIISLIAIAGFLAARGKANNAAQHVEEVRVIVNHQRDELLSRIEALEGRLKVANDKNDKNDKANKKRKRKGG